MEAEISKGTCDQDTANRAIIVAWRRATPEAKPRLMARFFSSNRGGLKKYFAKYDGDWLLVEAFLHLPKVFEGFDLKQGRMSVLGYWKQRLDWKLPDAWMRETNLIHPPKFTDKEIRAEVKEFYAGLDIVRPDAQTQYNKERHGSSESTLSADSTTYWNKIFSEHQQEVQDD